MLSGRVVGRYAGMYLVVVEGPVGIAGQVLAGRRVEHVHPLRVEPQLGLHAGPDTAPPGRGRVAGARGRARAGGWGAPRFGVRICSLSSSRSSSSSWRLISSGASYGT